MYAPWPENDPESWGEEFHNQYNLKLPTSLGFRRAYENARFTTEAN